jgi:hypothetical protein
MHGFHFADWSTIDWRNRAFSRSAAASHKKQAGRPIADRRITLAREACARGEVKRAVPRVRSRVCRAKIN